MIRLQILGTIELRGSDGHELRHVLAQPKRLGLLCYLAASRPFGFHRRDQLLALLWPELDIAHARSALNQAVRFLRRELSATEGSVIVSRGTEELSVSSDALWCDATAFQSALTAGHSEDALQFYQGDLLEGFHCDAGAEFDEWRDRERARLRGEAVRAARAVAERYATADSLTAAVGFARRAVELSDWDERLVRRLMELLDRAGDRSGALRVYDAFVRQLASQFDSAPAAETRGLMERIRVAPRNVPLPPPSNPPSTKISPEDALRALRDRYEVERPLGSGGMADIYLARDVRHHRRVALKMMRPEVSAALGPERFLREIAVTANLQHPHILSLYDSGQIENVLYYVMPFVEGESLRQRLRRERQLPVEEALRITHDIATALQYAHNRGIVHRDIKPENVLLQDGQALVADFGIAVAVSAATEDANTPTFGSPIYMSPERLSGDAGLDPRSDIYSLAIVLYEMLAGTTPPPLSDERSLTSNQVAEALRDLRSRRESVPPHVEEALGKALAVLPADRYSSAAAFANALEEPAQARPASQHLSVRQLAPRRRSRSIFVALALVLVGVLLSGADFTWRYLHPLDIASPHWDLLLPDSAPLAFIGDAPLGIGRTALAVSPDGSRIVYVGKHGSSQQLYVRTIGDLTTAALDETRGAYQPFFSPDGEWIGFFAGDELRKVSVHGGHPVTLARVREPFGAAWASDGRVLVAEGQGYRYTWVPVGGGASQPIPHQLAMKAVNPVLLPGDEWIVHRSLDGALNVSSLSTGISYGLTADGLVPRDSARPSALLYGHNPMYLASGDLAYFSNDDELMVLPFDVTRRRVLGPPQPVMSGVRLETSEGGAQFAVAHNGTLVYAPGESQRYTRLVWIDHATGRRDTVPAARGRYGAFRIAPDGKHVLVHLVTVAGPHELWVLDLERGSGIQVPTRGHPSQWLSWSPRSDAVVFTEFAPNGALPGVVVRQSLTDPSHRDTLETNAMSVDPAPDGKTLAILRGPDRLELRSTGQSEAIERNIRFLRFSPNSEWLVYTEPIENESEVYVTPVRHPQERYRVSAAGGEEPVWSPDGRSIVYRNRKQWLKADVKSFSPVLISQPRLLFEGPFANVPGVEHDISADGRRELVLLGSDVESTTKLVVVTNWFAELNRARRLARSR